MDLSGTYILEQEALTGRIAPHHTESYRVPTRVLCLTAFEKAAQKGKLHCVQLPPLLQHYADGKVTHQAQFFSKIIFLPSKCLNAQEPAGF